MPAEYREDFALIELKDDREIYLVPPSIARELPGEFFMATIRRSIGKALCSSGRFGCRRRTVRFWNGTARRRRRPRSLPGWVRIKANQGTAPTRSLRPSTIPEPAWPELSFQELLRIGFRDRLVDRLDHAVIKRLRGA